MCTGLRYVDLIEPAAQAFLENQLTAGHAMLIARLSQPPQAQALEASFRSHWGSAEKQAIPVRELAHWIRHNLMLQLEDAIFDREDETLLPEAGSCIRSTRERDSTPLYSMTSKTMIGASSSLLSLRRSNAGRGRTLFILLPKGTAVGPLLRREPRTGSGRGRPGQNCKSIATRRIFDRPRDGNQVTFSGPVFMRRRQFFTASKDRGSIC